MVGFVGLVLHAHLPFVRHPEHPRSLEGRWVNEAIWECYLPLIDVLDRLAADGVRAPFTLSVSPPLAAMLRDPLLMRRFDDHLTRIERLADGARRFVPATLGAVLDFYRRRLGRVRGIWERISGDVLGAFVAHARAGRVELWTSSATHAYLPALLDSPALVRAQIRVGRAAFTSLAGVEPAGFWLPECAFDPRLEPELAVCGATVTVLDAHGLELARPRPVAGAMRPVLSPSGVACFGRDVDASEDVWSRRAGYPGDPTYRDFYRDVGFDLPEEALGDEIGPGGTRVMTGLKLHRITGPGDAKAAYEPVAGTRRAREDAHDFVQRRARSLAASGVAMPIAVAPFDAELFGHWWFEGPTFLEEVLRGIAVGGDVQATGLAEHAARAPLEIVEPAASTWGEGGFGEVWSGPSTARIMRHARHAAADVLAALPADPPPDSPRGRALDQALIELLLLQSSDFPFMIWRDEMAEYAEGRLRAHASRAHRLAKMAAAPALTDEDMAHLVAIEQRDNFLTKLRGEPLREAFR